MTHLMVCLLGQVTGAAFGYALALRFRCGTRAPGIPIKLRHQTDAEWFTVGALWTIDNPVEMEALDGTVTSSVGGTFEDYFVVTEVDHAGGSITVRAR